MTRQNRIHRCVRKSEQSRKNFMRGFDRELGKRAPRHLRKWWNHDRWILVEENDDDSRDMHRLHEEDKVKEKTNG